MIFTYVLPAVLVCPFLYLTIYKIEHKFLSILLGNFLWILLFTSIFYFNDWVEDPIYFITLILPIIALSLALSLRRLILNYQKNTEI